ncbi:MAG: polysaccharide deacetylase family protein [Nanoarchaeota archaeon]|nr:polysaccharide deacetylase family protein [Nanoarchaeota archaeon]
MLYVLEFVFEDQFQVTSDIAKLGEGKILNYSKQQLNRKEQIWILPSGLLNHHSFDEDYQHDFQHQDILSSIFYVLCRYEEYLSSERDHFERFTAKQSELFESKKLEEPVVDEWVGELRSKFGLRTDFPYQFIPTFDIDNAWAYKNKGALRTAASRSRDLIQKNKKRIQERKAVLSGRMKDPYDTYDFIESLKSWNPKVFFLLGDYGKYDRNISWKNKEFQNLIRKIDQFAEVGIHPSFDSFDKPEKVKIEKARLEEIVGHEIIRSRQHFLRLNIPETYQNLEKIGIKEDYSMGYADHFGWRAGTSRPFYFFDLASNRKTALLVHQFQYMDGTLNEYMNLSIDQAKNVVEQLHHETKKFGGNFICLWHNETVGNYESWQGWQDVLNYNISLNE